MKTMPVPTGVIPAPNLPPLPKRVRGASGILEMPDNAAAPGYSETAVEEGFTRAGFTRTKPYVPKHDLDPMHAIESGRDPEQAWRIIRSAGSSAVVGGIRNDRELIAVRRHRHQMRDEWGNKPTPEATAEWADLHLR